MFNIKNLLSSTVTKKIQFLTLILFLYFVECLAPMKTVGIPTSVNKPIYS